MPEETTQKPNWLKRNTHELALAIVFLSYITSIGVFGFMRSSVEIAVWLLVAIFLSPCFVYWCYRIYLFRRTPKPFKPGAVVTVPGTAAGLWIVHRYVGLSTERVVLTSIGKRGRLTIATTYLKLYVPPAEPSSPPEKRRSSFWGDE